MRKDIIELLLDRPSTLMELAQELGKPLRAVEDDLQHLQKSVKHLEYEFVVEPARCKKCSFVFRDDKLQRPGKCPSCRSSWILAPRVSVIASSRPDRNS